MRTKFEFLGFAPGGDIKEQSERLRELLRGDVERRHGSPRVLGVANLIEPVVDTVISDWRTDQYFRAKQAGDDKASWRRVSMGFRPDLMIDRVTIEANMLKTFGVIPDLCLIVGREEQLRKQLSPSLQNELYKIGDKV
jgi:hypothetical protein